MDLNVTPVDNTNQSTYAPIPLIDVTSPKCQWILYAKVNNSRVRVWDLAIFVPNVLFLLFLVWKSRTAVFKLKNANSPIFTAFYVLVFIVACFSVLRCVTSMTVDATTEAGDDADKVLWLLLRFFLLATELSVVIFGLLFGHLDSRTSIQRVLIVTFMIALIYSVTQGVLELRYDHPTFTAKSDTSSLDNSTVTNFNIFAHGGMIFLFTSSFLNFLLYTTIIILPFTKLRERFQLPTKRLFYYYCLSLACLNLCQALAAMLLYLEFDKSLCAIDVTTFVYFTVFNPLVYGVFLWKFFVTSATGVQFSYKHQESYVEEDQVSLPYSHSSSTSKHDDHSPIFSHDSSMNSTHFDVTFSSTPQQTYTTATTSTRPRTAVTVNAENYSTIN